MARLESVTCLGPNIECKQFVFNQVSLSFLLLFFLFLFPSLSIISIALRDDRFIQKQRK